MAAVRVQALAPCATSKQFYLHLHERTDAHNLLPSAAQPCPPICLPFSLRRQIYCQIKRKRKKNHNKKNYKKENRVQTLVFNDCIVKQQPISISCMFINPQPRSLSHMALFLYIQSEGSGRGGDQGKRRGWGGRDLDDFISP